MVPKGRPKKDERPGKKKEVKKMVAGKKEPPGSKKEKKIPKKIPKFSADYEKTPEFDYEDLMKDPNFNKPDLICSPDPAEFNEDYYRRTGLRKPILFHCDPVELGMTIPDSRNFSVNDVLKLIGGNRLIEVVRVEDQSTIKMSLKQFIKYYNLPPEKRPDRYNVLSLEYSNTPLEDLVRGPKVVRRICWAENNWPDALKTREINFEPDGKHYTPFIKYPCIKNYCQMSVASSYTDFHVDFGGTSVWLHVIKGEKVFFIIPPTPENLRKHERHLKNEDDKGFFGKSVDVCARVVLRVGDTFILPSGYIHAVYTPVDSIVLSGNFVHTLSCQMQLEVQKSEQRLKLQSGFRMPYTHQLMFYVVADLVKKWTRREYLRPLKIEDKRTYVGERWLKAKGHRLEITLANFGDTDEKEPENEKENVPKKREAQFASSSPLVFYRSEAYDLVADKPLKAHKMEVGEEPPFEFVSKEIRRITKMELEEYDALYEYLQGRPQVEVAKGISQPASLLKCFGKALNHRRKQFAKERRKNESEKEVEETTERKRKLEAEVLKEKDEKMVKNRRVWNPCQSPEEENETDDPEVENMQLENAEVDKKKFFSSFSLFNAPDGDEKNHRNFLGFPVLNRSNRNWDDFLSYRNPVSEPSGPLISLPKEESEDGIEAEIDENEPDFHSSSYYIEEDFSTNLEPMLEIDFPEGEENEQDFQTFEFEPSLEMESFVPEEPEELILMPFVPWSPGDIEITISTSGDACYPCDDVGGPTDVAEQ